MALTLCAVDGRRYCPHWIVRLLIIMYDTDVGPHWIIIYDADAGPHWIIMYDADVGPHWIIVYDADIITHF